MLLWLNGEGRAEGVDRVNGQACPLCPSLGFCADSAPFLGEVLISALKARGCW